MSTEEERERERETEFSVAKQRQFPDVTEEGGGGEVKWGRGRSFTPVNLFVLQLYTLRDKSYPYDGSMAIGRKLLMCGYIYVYILNEC